ncbi:hypothetical protein [Paenibacillus cremeus]|uniref:Uncharacterized protein n=1 Tax=Paenibacillus cremeus TaxID=2163881 RepID=A0A559K8B7_9BACL|nr:hypothetical protein [Paenibacillus cremeus]TVY08372.1 hypothetical protein FPZ49_19205 [Paenibacillus cremeus]
MDKHIEKCIEMSMTRLVHALKTRGFHVGHLTNQLWLKGGSGRHDQRYLREVLGAAQIGFREQEEMFILESFLLTEEVIDRIEMYKAYNQESWCPLELQSWKAFTKRRHGLKLDTLTLDPGVSYLIKQLSHAGILTMMSCDGHGRSSPKIWFSGLFSAAWFEIIINKLMKLEGLHYTWIVEEDTRNYRILTARKLRGEQWDRRHVQEDSIKLGEWFAEHAKELRENKQCIYKHRSMKARATSLVDNYDELKNWMNGIYSSYIDESQVVVQSLPW